MIESFLYKGPGNGKQVLILGAIHGDELCGPDAIYKIMHRLDRGELVLTQGSVRFVPICNPEAYARRKRVFDENLNRIFKRTENPKSYEARLANELCDLIDEADVVLDIHSSAVPAPTNVFVDYPTPENLGFARALEADFLIFDWPKVYEENSFSFPSWTTDRYAHEAGKIGILAECGQHEDPISKQRAVTYILRALDHFGLISIERDPSIQVSREVSMKQIFQREHLGDHFLKSWSHLEIIPKDTVIAIRENGMEIVAEEDSYILFPKEYAQPGDEWFYLAHAK